MKRLLKIKFSTGSRFKVRVRAVKLPARAGLPSSPVVVAILPDGKVVRLPELPPSASNERPRRGSSALAVLPPCSLVPGRALARRPCRGDSSPPVDAGSDNRSRQ